MSTGERQVQSWYLEYTEGTSNKFYFASALETGVCVLSWGRIGTSGQGSVSHHGAFQEARDIALRQVYAKKSKGYQARHDGLEFKISQSDFLAVKAGDHHRLLSDFWTAVSHGRFTLLRDAVLTQYEALVEQAHALIQGAGNAEETLNSYADLERAWSDICDKHAEVEIIMDLAKSMTATRLVAGS